MGLPELIGGKYRVLRELARGGMGVIYAVEHQGTGEELALKLMSERLLHAPDAVERFKREARAPTRIRSDHVVRVIDADTAPELGGAPFLVMELLDGHDLEQLSKREPPAPHTVVDWLLQAARALDRAHALGFVHRDLKPANLFLARRPDGPPIVKVLDFGIVKVMEGAGATESGASLGTPRYMAPEQVLAERGAVGPAADVWAMGLVAFRLLAGEDYWRGDSNVMIVGSILHGTIATPKERGCDLGPAFDAWFLRSCSRDPAARFPSVGAQMRALASALGSPEAPRASPTPEGVELPPSSEPAPAPAPVERTGDAVSMATPREARPTASSRAAYAAFVGFIVLGASVTWWFSTRGEGSRSAASSFASSAPSSVASGAAAPPASSAAPAPPDGGSSAASGRTPPPPSALQAKARPPRSASPTAPLAPPSASTRVTPRDPLADPL